MKMIEATGKDLNDALAQGIKTLGVNLDEVTYEILSQNETETKVRISIKEPRQYLQILTTFVLTSMGFKVNVSVNKDEQGYTVNIRTRQGDTLLIGQNGENLWALQYIISRLAKRFYSNIKLLVDVNGYRQRRTNLLRKKAEAIARIVLQTGREMALDPLTPREEKIVANKINELKGVKLYTIGRGSTRTVIIAPETEDQEERRE
ncbi:MAG: Jag N-terminal domain-containing protein [candidate division WOR-3 bacterium]|nr:Jag N-terminal domain-containing protein [candidate division WOR-3 bacterium]